MKSMNKSVALFVGGVFCVSAVVAPSAQADSKKEKQLKTGAAVLGAIGAYFAVKGKTVPAVVAGAGAYYAYKKSKDARDDYSYNTNTTRDRYLQRTRSNQNNEQSDEDLGYESLTTKTATNHTATNHNAVGNAVQQASSDKATTTATNEETSVPIAEKDTAPRLVLD